MRKADYSLLARIIADSIKLHGTSSPAANIAYLFAQSANVNKTEFLKACGIE